MFVSHFMATLSFAIFVRQAASKRKALRAKLPLDEPAMARSAGPAGPPYATVVTSPPHASNVDVGAGFGRRAGPIAEAIEGVGPNADSNDEPPSLGGSATLALRSPAAFQDTESRSSSAPVSGAAMRRPSTRSPFEITREVLDAELRPVSGEKDKLWWRDAGSLAAVGGSDGEIMQSTPEELAEAASSEARSGSAAAAAFFRKLWDDVKEEPQIGFRCGCCRHDCCSVCMRTGAATGSVLSRVMRAGSSAALPRSWVIWCGQFGRSYLW